MKRAVSVLLICSLSACAMGGGTYGTGLPGDSAQGAATYSPDHQNLVTISGILWDERGNPVRGITVAVQSGARTFFAQADSTGRFSVSIRKDGPSTITFIIEGRAGAVSQSVELPDIKSAEYELLLDHGQVLKVRRH
ncbi:MAG: hypothetical protein U0136_16400 [Bdellovibrionota bacterium]